MSIGDPFEQLGDAVVSFRNGQTESLAGVRRKEADVIVDHLGRMLMEETAAPRFAAIRRPDFSYAVDLTQVRSICFTPYGYKRDEDRWDRENREARKEFSKVSTHLPDRAIASKVSA